MRDRPRKPQGPTCGPRARQVVVVARASPDRDLMAATVGQLPWRSGRAEDVPGAASHQCGGDPRGRFHRHSSDAFADHPSTDEHRRGPRVDARWSASAAAAATWSRTVHTETGAPQPTVRRGRAGPVLTCRRRARSARPRTGRWRCISARPAGSRVHQPGVGWPGPEGPRPWLSPVSACHEHGLDRSSAACPRSRRRYVRQFPNGLQPQRAVGRNHWRLRPGRPPPGARVRSSAACARKSRLQTLEVLASTRCRPTTGPAGGPRRDGLFRLGSWCGVVLAGWHDQKERTVAMWTAG